MQRGNGQVRRDADSPLEGDGFEPSVPLSAVNALIKDAVSDCGCPMAQGGDHSLIFLGTWGMSNKKTFSKNSKGGYIPRSISRRDQLVRAGCLVIMIAPYRPPSDRRSCPHSTDRRLARFVERHPELTPHCPHRLSVG